MKNYIMSVMSALKLVLIPLYSAELFLMLMRKINPEAPDWTNSPALSHLIMTVSVMYVALSLIIYGYRDRKNKAPYTVPIAVIGIICYTGCLVCLRLGSVFPEGDTSIPAMAVKSVYIALSAAEAVCAFLFIPFALSGASPSKEDGSASSFPEAAQPEETQAPVFSAETNEEAQSDHRDMEINDRSE